MNIREESLAKHYEWKGKIEVVSRVRRALPRRAWLFTATWISPMN